MTNLRLAVILLTVAIAGVVLSTSSAPAERSRKEMFKATMPAVTMVVAVDVIGGQLTPVSSGSGTIIHHDGSILTNYHVIRDPKRDRLHDLFIIGRYQAADREPLFVCAGKPSRGKLKPALDLALLKCDLDMNGRPWRPGHWPTLPLGRSEDVVPGQQVWILGYPNVGGGTIHVTAGLVSGWTGEKGGAGSRAYMKTDAAITLGNSGGTAIDEDGLFLGVPTAFRVTTMTSAESVSTVDRVGLIRPIEHARDLLAVADGGWTPTESAAEPASGAVIRGRLVAAANGRPINGGFVVVFRAGLTKSEVDLKKLEGQAIAWAQSNALGHFELNGPVPRGQRHTVAIVATGFAPVIVEDGLTVPADAPDVYEPWPPVQLAR